MSLSLMPLSPRSAKAQRAVLALSALCGGLGLFWIGKSFFVDGRARFGNPVAEPESVSESPPPLAVRAEITRVSLGDVARPGQMCEFLVQRKPRKGGAYECNAQVVCGNKLLYGGPERGYFPCSISDGLRKDVVGIDPSTSRHDHDPALKIDTRLGVLSIWDDESGELGAYQLEAEILSAQ